MNIHPKPRARFTPRLATWACWLQPDGWKRRMVGFGYTLSEALADLDRQCRALAGEVQ